MIWITGAAVVLRLLLLIGRGHYVAFDEGWYLLLARNLWSGDGYTLSGLQHVALSPLFPLLAGALDRVFGNPVWAGRIVAAMSSGLVVIPCWFIFRRLAEERVAVVGTVCVALMPSLAPFVVPYWIGWDLWVGAEPLLHLLLYSGIALLLVAWEERRIDAAAGCGGAFALAYLARPEAILSFGLLGLLALALLFLAWNRRTRGPGDRTPGEHAPTLGGGNRSRPVLALACAVFFAGVSTPYWVYLHDVLDRWTITGRWVQVAPPSVSPATGTASSPNRIEEMLWDGNASAYIRSLYSLNAPATALANGYWGVQPEAAEPSGGDAASSGVGPSVNAPPRDSSPGAAEATVTDGSGVDPRVGSSSGAEVPSTPVRQEQEQEEDPRSPWLLRYAEALGVAVPWYLWLLVAPGLLAAGRVGRVANGQKRRLDLELLVGLPLVATSLLIARVVAIDPRTQLFIAPLAAFYAARGILVLADRIGEGMGEHVRKEVVTRILVGAVAAIMLVTSAVRLVMSLTVGSPHHVVGAQNAEVGEAIREATSEDAVVMSFHPALALFADRDWRVLPLEPMDRIVRYARTQPNPYMVLSVFYPPELRPAEEPHYLIVPVPEDRPESNRWRIDIPRPRTVYAFGELVPVD